MEPEADVTCNSPLWQLIRKNEADYDFNCSRNLSTTMLTISLHSVIAPKPISLKRRNINAYMPLCSPALTNITTCEVLLNWPDNIVSYDLTYDAKVLSRERVFVHECSSQGIHSSVS